MSFRCHLALRKLFPTLAMSLLLFGLSNLKAVADDNDPERYLFICTADQARTAPDFLAVINFDQESRDYGKVITTVPFAAPDATGNEPHHIGLSADRKTVACGGLLSILVIIDRGYQEIYALDLDYR